MFRGLGTVAIKKPPCLRMSKRALAILKQMKKFPGEGNFVLSGGKPGNWPCWR
jgi:hypothetical protein